jgi:integrase
VFPTWTPSELRRFLLAASDDPWYPAFHLAAFTGLRRCEVLGLRWTDIDFDGAQLQVVQTVVVVGWYPTLSEPKTEKSRRAVALDKNTVEVLRAHRRRAQGTADDRSLVFPGLGGGPTNPAHLSYRFQRALRGCDVPRIRFHDLRHTHATLALRAGIHPKIVSERLGHATIGLTLDIYSHALPSMQREAAEAVASLVDQIESDGEEK